MDVFATNKEHTEISWTDGYTIVEVKMNYCNVPCQPTQYCYNEGMVVTRY